MLGAFPFEQQHDHVGIRRSRWSLLQRGSGKDLLLVVVTAAVVVVVEVVEAALEVVAMLVARVLDLEDFLKKALLEPLLEEETGSAHRKFLSSEMCFNQSLGRNPALCSAPPVSVCLPMWFMQV